jgi:SAM-dependent methyltransferase
LFRRYALPYFSNQAVVLEVSPDFHHRLDAPSATWHTVGPNPDSRLTFFSSEYSFPVADASYGIVLSTNVLEHVRCPWRLLAEMRRVCWVGGVIINIVPATWPLHRDPIDCWRIYPDGMKALYDDAGLEVLTCLARCDKPSRFWRPQIIDTIGIGRKVCPTSN